MSSFTAVVFVHDSEKGSYVISFSDLEDQFGNTVGTDDMWDSFEQAVRSKSDLPYRKWVMDRVTTSNGVEIIDFAKLVLLNVVHAYFVSPEPIHRHRIQHVSYKAYLHPTDTYLKPTYLSPETVSKAIAEITGMNIGVSHQEDLLEWELTCSAVKERDELLRQRVLTLSDQQVEVSDRSIRRGSNEVSFVRLQCGYNPTQFADIEVSKGLAINQMTHIAATKLYGCSTLSPNDLDFSIINKAAVVQADEESIFQSVPVTVYITCKPELYLEFVLSSIAPDPGTLPVLVMLKRSEATVENIIAAAYKITGISERSAGDLELVIENKRITCIEELAGVSNGSRISIIPTAELNAMTFSFIIRVGEHSRTIDNVSFRLFPLKMSYLYNEARTIFNIPDRFAFKLFFRSVKRILEPNERINAPKSDRPVEIVVEPVDFKLVEVSINPSDFSVLKHLLGPNAVQKYPLVCVPAADDEHWKDTLIKAVHLPPSVAVVDVLTAGGVTATSVNGNAALVLSLQPATSVNESPFKTEEIIPPVSEVATAEISDSSIQLTPFELDLKLKVHQVLGLELTVDEIRAVSAVERIDVNRGVALYLEKKDRKPRSFTEELDQSYWAGVCIVDGYASLDELERNVHRKIFELKNVHLSVATTRLLTAKGSLEAAVDFYVEHEADFAENRMSSNSAPLALRSPSSRELPLELLEFARELTEEKRAALQSMWNSRLLSADEVMYSIKVMNGGEAS